MHWLPSSMFTFPHKYLLTQSHLEGPAWTKLAKKLCFLVRNPNNKALSNWKDPAFQSKQTHKIDNVPFSKGLFSQAAGRSFPVASSVWRNRTLMLELQNTAPWCFWQCISKRKRKILINNNLQNSKASYYSYFILHISLSQWSLQKV